MKVRGWLSLLGTALSAASCAAGSISTSTSASSGGGGMPESTVSSGGHGGHGGQGMCTSPSDCPSPPSACVIATCDNNVCGTHNALQGTIVAKHVPANCHATVCDGQGNTTDAVDPDNVPMSSNACLIGTCDKTGLPGTMPIAEGAPCTTTAGSGRCNGAGDCVECLTSSDCPSGQSCSPLNTCMGPPCMDGVKDANETDIDCGGGTCPPCSVDKTCKIDTDCASNQCDPLLHICLNSACSDGKKDGNETDIDCGGSCSACALGKACAVTQDCSSKACDAVSLTCVGNRCIDHQKDGSETDVDCGGSCTPCGIGKGCALGSDCLSGSCDAASRTCADNPCGNGVKDGLETDVDCGGGICPTCALEKACQNDLDCTSYACDTATLLCVADSCADHHTDGTETDIDCGGPDCTARCATGKRCKSASDCAAGAKCTTTNPHICN